MNFRQAQDRRADAPGQIGKALAAGRTVIRGREPEIRPSGMAAEQFLPLLSLPFAEMLFDQVGFHQQRRRRKAEGEDRNQALSACQRQCILMRNQQIDGFGKRLRRGVIESGQLHLRL